MVGMGTAEPRSTAGDRAARWGWSRSAAAFEAAPDAYLLTDASGVIRRANRVATQLLDVRSAALVGRPIAAIVASESLAELEMHLATALEASAPTQEWELRLLRRGQEPFVAAVTVKAARDSHGRLLGLHWLVRDATHRKAAEERLQASLREKELLLREVYHRVKNNLQIISSLLSLQASACAAPEASAALTSARRRVHAMALIHERLYASADMGAVDFAAFVRQAFATASATDDVTLEVRVSAGLGVDAAIPCGMIVNELLQNALKHAFTPGRSGRIRVSLGVLGTDRLRLDVADDGCGMADGASVGLGLRLVEILAGQIHGTLDVKHMDPGTLFRIVFPA
jgi:PAS domain S-box-containing protein